MLFSETLATMRVAKDGWSAEIGEDWSQGRATFGGMVAALGNRAMRGLVPADRELRGLETIFVGPTLAGSVRIEAEILRVGRVVTIAAARLWSADKIAATLTGIYGGPRSSELVIAPPTPVAALKADTLPDSTFPQSSGGPAFLQHFGMRWAEGTRPFSGSTLNRSKAYIRHKENAPLTESHLVALIDCTPSPILQTMTAPVPSSSLTWTLQFLRHDYNFPATAWWRIDTDVNAAGNGYSCESSTVLDPSGTPMALSRQLVAVFG
jgi:acyl-CoA thioesterase